LGAITARRRWQHPRAEALISASCGGAGGGRPHLDYGLAEVGEACGAWGPVGGDNSR
jgi:hypothetical protein